MTFKQTYLFYGRKAFFCLILMLLVSNNLHAQLSSRIYRTKLLYDTLVADNNRDFMYNNINITNLTTDSISIFLTITMPEGWTLTTQKVMTVSLPGNQNTIISLRLLPAKSISANWEQVKIEYRLNKGMETLTDTFKVKVQEFTKFKARLPMPDMILGAYQKDITFPVYVKNTGNVPKNYTIHYNNNLLNLNYKQPLHLDPQQDTTYKIPLKLSDGQWSMLRKEEVKVQVSVEDGETVNLLQEISKIGYMLKEHSSAYLDMPLQLETGMTSQGSGNLQYYGALHGRIDLKERERIMFDIRSKTFAQGQFQNNDIYRFEYEGEKWSGSAGNIMQLADFVMDGYGVSVAHKWKNDINKVGLYSLLKSRSGNSKLIGGNASVLVKDKVVLTESAVANFDQTNQVNSYLVKQEASSKLTDEMSLRVVMGAGIEQITRPLAAGTKKAQLGTSLGYNFSWNAKHINVISNLMTNSNSYPGVFKGQRSQTHDVRGIYDRYFLGGFYEYNLRKQNIYVDTQLFSDVFNLKTASYGAKAGVSFRNSNLTFSVGKQRQQQSDTGSVPIYEYRFLNLSTSVMLGQRSYVNLNSYYGRGVLVGYEDTTGVNVMSNQGALQVYFAGVSARYDIGPYFYHDYLKYLQKPEQYRRLVLGPYAELNLFKRSLTIRSQMNYNKSLPSNTESANVMGNLIYHNYRRGFDFNVSGIMPVNQPNAQPYIAASLRVRLNVPFVAVRKYYQLKLVLFKDVNTNGKLDEGEGPIAEQMLALNDNLFVSDGRGVVIFKNVEKKDFKVDFGYTSKIKGWIPQGGTIQTFAVTGNKTIYIPYKKSKVLSGKLNVQSDKNSNIEFKPGNIKVTATSNDTLRSSFSTLTDENGEFYFNLPAGVYTVTLSEVAFDDNFKPTEYAQQADL
ncbi:MAG: carboxypeptidase regulatory-like domain-containing protein, partial [Chitinophagaceae bacterium]|nr:carboxypeptidase regulatory-like domain-containing protein [Chitinophagaceae bacterium]